MLPLGLPSAGSAASKAEFTVRKPLSVRTEAPFEVTEHVAGRPLAATPEKPSVPAFEFSTLDLPPEEQFLAWRASYAPMVDLTEPDDFTVDFLGEQVLWDLGHLVFSRVRTDGLGFASLSGHVRRDPVDHWLISVMLSGSSVTIAPKTTFKGHTRSVQIHPLGKVFEGVLTDSEMLQLFVPRDFFRGMVDVLDRAEFSTRDDGMAKLLGDYLAGLARCLPSMDAKNLPKLVTATKAMILACVAPAPDRLHEASDAISFSLLERARCFVQANIRAPDLSVSTLQRELGISRSRLYRLFEPYGGVFHYIQHRRLVDAHSALADPRDTRRILDIAEERGFPDASEFSRAFKREFGYSPREVRMSCKTLPCPSPAGLDDVAPVDRLGVLLGKLQA